MLKVGLVPCSYKALKVSTILSSLFLLFVSPVMPINWQSVSVGLKVLLKVKKGNKYFQESKMPCRTCQAVSAYTYLNHSLKIYSLPFF